MGLSECHLPAGCFVSAGTAGLKVDEGAASQAREAGPRHGQADPRPRALTDAGLVPPTAAMATGIPLRVVLREHSPAGILPTSCAGMPCSLHRSHKAPV